MPRSAAILKKNRGVHQKDLLLHIQSSYGHHFGPGDIGYILKKLTFILEQIRIIEFCPFDHYHTINKDMFITSDARDYMAYGKQFALELRSG